MQSLNQVFRILSCKGLSEFGLPEHENLPDLKIDVPFFSLLDAVESNFLYGI